MNHHIEHLPTFVAILLVACFVGIAVKWIKMPYTIGLVLAGLMIGEFSLLPVVRMDPHMVLFIMLPPLLFTASYNIDLSKFRYVWGPVLLLGTIGVLISTIIIGCGLHYGLGMNALLGLIIGAILATTDPVAVVAIFQKLDVDEKTIYLMEGESLINDGIAVAVFLALEAALISGFPVSQAINQASINFLTMAGGGLLLGVFFGYGLSKVQRLYEDHLLQIALTIVVAYGTFIVAENMHVSAIIAVVTASVVFGHMARMEYVSPTTLYSTQVFWDSISFIVNSCIFILVGMELSNPNFYEYRYYIVATLAISIVARLILAYGIAPLASSRFYKITLPIRHLLFFGALRGALSMAMALSIPLEVEAREMIITVTYSVVLISLVAQGLSIEKLSQIFKLIEKEDVTTLANRLHLKLAAEEQVNEYLREMYKEGRVSGSVYDQLKSRIKAKQLAYYEHLHEMSPSNDRNTRKELHELIVHLDDKRKVLLESIESGEVSLTADADHLQNTEQKPDPAQIN